MASPLPNDLAAGAVDQIHLDHLSVAVEEIGLDAPGGGGGGDQAVGV